MRQVVDAALDELLNRLPFKITPPSMERGSNEIVVPLTHETAGLIDLGKWVRIISNELDNKEFPPLPAVPGYNRNSAGYRMYDSMAVSLGVHGSRVERGGIIAAVKPI